MRVESHPASFRDRAGYVFYDRGLVLRHITSYGVEDYKCFMGSGLYQEAKARQILIPHEGIECQVAHGDGLVIYPEQVPFLTYPYEWCFSQLKDAALLVLEAQELALGFGMSLKDATAYNVQFLRGSPILIDTSSFEKYREGEPWVAYRQFCEHFLNPLLLMSRLDGRLGPLQASFLDGIPIDLVAKMLPAKTWLNLWLALHVRLHSAAQKSRTRTTAKPMPKTALLGLLRSLRQAVQSLKWNLPASTWGDYSSGASYDEASARAKHELVESYFYAIQPEPRTVWDLGANSGDFSRIASNRKILTIAWDGDAVAVERNYCEVRRNGETHLLPLIQDFANPSPSLGWQGAERASFFERGPADAALALALIHHLVIGNSVPMAMAAAFFARVTDHLIIEFVAPEDPRVRQLLETRRTYHPYDQATFESAFRTKFDILSTDPVGKSCRKLYRMRRKP